MRVWEDHMKVVGIGICVLFTLIVPCGRSSAQSGGLASITGQAQDSTGAVLPGASVTLSSNDKGFELRHVTDEKGNFVFQFLPPGSYIVTVALQGFSTARMDGNPAGVIRKSCHPARAANWSAGDGSPGLGKLGRD